MFGRHGRAENKKFVLNVATLEIMKISGDGSVPCHRSVEISRKSAAVCGSGRLYAHIHRKLRTGRTGGFGSDSGLAIAQDWNVYFGQVHQLVASEAAFAAMRIMVHAVKTARRDTDTGPYWRHRPEQAAL